MNHSLIIVLKKYTPIFSAVFFFLSTFLMFYEIFYLLLLLGVLCLLISILALIFLNDIDKTGIEIFGRIVAYDSDEEGYKTPVIEFQSSDGKLYRGTPLIHASSDIDKFRSYQENINKKIKILYSADCPENFIIKGKTYTFFLNLLAIVGLTLIICSIAKLLGYDLIC
ncbi:DUF3592 domain-containing protein [Flavobacterium anhuiense]|uniref:DUF3592 domain-containing protein n=1 Tax=Flavobacterium anhuiense TaxID=459526 RepID=UPI0034D96E55